MKANDENLTQVFDKAIRLGVASLSSEEHELYLIQDFILEWEMGSLTGYFYDRLPNLDHIADTISAMRLHSLDGLADILNDALSIFRDYVEPSEPTTWGQVMRKYDPVNRLNGLDESIRELSNYGHSD